MNSFPLNVLITGASSGIGAALAVECAKSGAKTLFLCARNSERLKNVCNNCSAHGAKVFSEVLDVTDEDAVRAWLKRCDEIAPIEVAFANAGIATGSETEDNVRRTFSTNVFGVLNVALPLIDFFRNKEKSRSERQIVITASIAGYAPLPTCPAYAGTKAAMKNWGLSLRGLLREEGIKVNVIAPGFIRSRITDENTCPMPFFMEADKAATIILGRVIKNVGLISFPWPMRFVTWFLSILPWRLQEYVSKLLPKKNEQVF